MKIANLTIFQIRLPLRRAIKHASHARTETDNLVIRCTLANGTVGYGEGVPRDYVTGETIDSDVDLLKKASLVSQLVSCGSFSEAVQIATGLELPASKDDARGCQANAARCALELAILDAYGRHFGEPLRRVTQLVAPEICEERPWVQYSGVITSAQGKKLLGASLVMRLYGFGQLKIKVGIDGQNDVQRLRLVRLWAGRKMNLRIDANESWTPDNMAAKIRELEPFGIGSVEQPVRHEDVRCLKEVRREVATPIMLDESLCSLYDAEQAAAHGTCDLFNLRLSKCGGFIETLRLAQFAKAHGIGCQLGCQVGESAILSAAGRHFAASVAGLVYLEGSYDRHLVRESLGRTNLTFGRGGWAPALRGPGLGVEIDRAALARVTIREETILG